MKKHLISLLIVILLSSTAFMGVSFPLNSLGSGNHAPIRIIGNDQFTEENGVTGGSGTEEDPYIIENWVIVKDGSASQGIFINNTDKHFIIKNCTISGFYHPDDFYQGIEFSEVKHGRIEDTKVNESGTGISIKYSTEIELENCSCSDCPVYPDGQGIGIYWSTNITIISSICYNMSDGIEIFESSDITIQKTECHNNTGEGLFSTNIPRKPILRFFIENCTFKYNGGDGACFGGSTLPHSSGLIIRNSSFYSNGLKPMGFGMGIWINRILNITIENCVFDHNYYGLYIGDRSKNTIIRNCSFISQIKDGIQIAGDPLFLSFAPNTEISYCDFIENNCGLSFFATRGTRVHHCYFINNSIFGILFTFCSSKITSNNFFNNGRESPWNGSCGAFIWGAFTDLRNNYWGNSEGPSISFIVRSTNNTAKLVLIRTIDDSDAIIFQGLFGRCVSHFRPWLSEPVPDAGRQT
jgi:parallel beta-helix repeat protein